LDGLAAQIEASYALVHELYGLTEEEIAVVNGRDPETLNALNAPIPLKDGSVSSWLQWPEWFGSNPFRR
jgi:hypothetical protein